MSTRRTYWHLEGRGRVPTDYEIVTSKLLYYPSQGLSVHNGGTEWLERYQHDAGLRCDDWDAFEDPRATTYTSYVALQQQRTIHVQSVLESVDDAAWPEDWLQYVREVISPLRYPAHALQMASAYLGSMAPSGRLAVALAFQTGDAIRVVQHLAERLGMLRTLHPDIAQDARARWESDPAWQPWRRLLERLLVTYGFQAGLVALNVVVKPAFDALFLGGVARAALAVGDVGTQQLLRSLALDGQWQREWTAALVRQLARHDPANVVRLQRLADAFLPATREAVEAGAVRLDALAKGAQSSVHEVLGLQRTYLAELGLTMDAPSARGADACPP